MKPADLVDRALEFPVVTSFSRIGYSVRRRVDEWRPLDGYDLSGRVVVVTGPTSGLGLAAVEWFARLGARLELVARDQAKVEALAERLVTDHGAGSVGNVVADLGDHAAIRRAVEELRDRHSRIDVLVHNAGSLFNERRTLPDGSEATVAVQVVGPFLMTGLLLGTMGPGSRVLTMSSGGMYTVPLTVDGIEMPEDRYRGATQYALAKRAQVTLNEMWAERLPELRFHAMHPGWADTPGVEESLPAFRRIVGPLLRTPEQGADTMVWLAADEGLPAESTGKFWLDRRVRPIHKMGRTRRSDTAERRRGLWRWVSDRAGWDLQ